jgi:hypothetical protein
LSEKFILTKENYFSPEAHKKYFSVSQFKSFMQCEARTMAEINGLYKRPESDDLLFGKAVHSWSEGVLEIFKLNNPGLYKKDGTLYAKFTKIDDCINTLEKDSVIQMALKGKKEVMFTGKLFGAMWKILIDIYNLEDGIFSDLKVMKDIYSGYWVKNEDGTNMKVSFVEYYMYHLQMAIYAEIERLANKRDEYLDPHIIVVTKENPPDKIILKGFVEEIPYILQQVESKMPRFIAVKNGEVEPDMCGHCDYCRRIKKAKIIDYRDLLWEKN